MSTELSNLLPLARKRAFRKRYFFRLATLLILLLTFVVIVHGLLLLPSYLYASGEVHRKGEELAKLETGTGSAEEAAAAGRAALLKGSVEYLAKRDGMPQASAVLAAVLAVPRAGIAITGFTYTAPGAPGGSGKLSIAGTASSRDALRQYAAALGGLPFVTSADLPISAYAQERDIPFTITLSGTLRP